MMNNTHPVAAVAAKPPPERNSHPSVGPTRSIVPGPNWLNENPNKTITINKSKTRSRNQIAI